MGLGILGLAGIVGLTVSAQGQIKIFDNVYNVNPLWQPNLAAGNPLVGAGPIYREALISEGDQSALTTPAAGGGTTRAPFQVVTDTTDTRFQWLDGGDSSGVAESPGDDTSATNPVSAMYMLLTGDKVWADVSLTTKAVMWNANSGGMLMILRAAPKTKVGDPNSYYALHLSLGNNVIPASMLRDGLITPNDTSVNGTEGGGGAEGITLRILKRVNGKWTQLAEVNQDKTTVHIPRINNLGVDHDESKGADGLNAKLTGGYFQFVAKGTTLTGNVSLDGKTFIKAIEATDAATDALKAGLVGFAHYDIEPVLKDIRVVAAS
jgi:hypothetical protein